MDAQASRLMEELSALRHSGANRLRACKSEPLDTSTTRTEGSQASVEPGPVSS